MQVVQGLRRFGDSGALGGGGGRAIPGVSRKNQFRMLGFRILIVRENEPQARKQWLFGGGLGGAWLGSA